MEMIYTNGSTSADTLGTPVKKAYSQVKWNARLRLGY
jgi:hypothetical protein